MAETFAPSVCLECTKHQKNCCTNWPRIPPTIEDIKRIVSMGHKKEDFLIVREYTKEDMEDDEAWWKGSMIGVDGKSFKLNTRKTKDGHCVFLIPGKGCSLGKDRPPVCKIFPFWVDDKGNVIYEPGDKFCHFEKQGASVKEGLKLVHETEESVREHFSKIKEDCIRNRKEHAKLVLEILSRPESERNWPVRKD